MRKLLTYQIIAAVWMIILGVAGEYIVVVGWEDPAQNNPVLFPNQDDGQTMVAISLGEIEEYRDAIRTGVRLVGNLFWAILGAGILMTILAYLSLRKHVKSENDPGGADPR